MGEPILRSSMADAAYNKYKLAVRRVDARIVASSYHFGWSDLRSHAVQLMYNIK
jgi:hypothetical protein